ncbi:ferritin-like domain-containing protein [Kitasatospora sp. NPDC050543]|uniref:ferritin-like domain-containing protein n=1 Tax=Kitasatospora sp. NPDC050543 TaxID=3364054 RepID=UPI0037A3B248
MQAPTRRTALALGLLVTAGALAACTDTHPDKDKDSGEQHGPDPDQPLRTRAVADTDALLAGYDAVLAGPGAGQAGRLQPLRAEVAQHRAALAEGLPAPAATTTPAASPTATGTATDASATPGATASAALPTSVAALAAAERQTAQARLTDLTAASPALAALLAAVSASGALHAAALGDRTPVIGTTAPAPSADASPAPTAPTASAPSAPSASASTAPASPPPSAPSADGTAALQSALAAEHAAIYGYGVIGARLPDDQQRTDARSAFAAHEARRDAWQRLLAGAGASPAAAAPGYQLPFAVSDAATAGKLAAHVETRLTDVYAALVGQAAGPLRLAAADALRECALRARQWGATPTAFPGLPDPAATAAPTGTGTPGTGTPTAPATAPR